MEHNLATPWNDGASGPQTPFLAFYSIQAPDFLFRDGPEIEIFCQAGLRSVGLTWTLHRNMVRKPFREGKAEAFVENRFRIALPTEGLPPGFYDLRVALDTGVAAGTDNKLGKRPVTGVSAFGWRVDEMPVADTRPADFKAFWAKALEEIKDIAPDPQLGPVTRYNHKAINEYNLASACLPADFDPEGHRCDEVESYKINIAGPDGGRIYGWLAKPVGAGPFPAMLVLPGGGVGARPRPLEHARHGYVALDIIVHDLDVDLEKYEAPDGYYANQVYEPASGHYFYNVHRRAYMAMSYLASLPFVDAKRLVVVGGSQGGRMSVVMAGLDSRVAAAVPAIAHFGNQPYLWWFSRVNGFASPDDRRPDPDLTPTDGLELVGPPAGLGTTAAEKALAYYDPMNFAMDAQCPVLFNMGLIDGVSFPAGVYAAYAKWGHPDRTLLPMPGLAHDWSAEFDRRAFRWLDEKLGNR